MNKIFSLIFCPKEPSKDNNRWPAIIFAVSRIVKVNGRIIKLIDSIITIKGINKIGVPRGVKWAKRLFKKLKILNIIILIQIVKDKEREKFICLEAVKM